MGGAWTNIDSIRLGCAKCEPCFRNKIDICFLLCTAVGDSKRIQLENMLGVYLVLAAGGCFSVILVLVEMWWRKHGTNVMAALRTKYPFMR